MTTLSSVTKRLKPSFHNVSAEPAIFVCAFAVYLYSAGITNLIQQKVCSPESPPPVDFICNDTVLLAQATDIVTVRATLKQALPAIILLLAGFWRDSTGLNKPIIYFSLFSEFFGICIQMFAYLNWTSSPWITSITEGIVNGLGGGISLFLVGTTCAIIDKSSVESRTSRLTFVYAETTIGACLAYGIVGPCLKYMGYIWLLILNISLQLATGVLIMIFVKDKRKQEKKGDIRELLKQLISAFKPRPNISVIWFMVIAFCSISITKLAEINIYQYYLEQAFGYSIEEAGLYIAYRLIVTSVGSIIVSLLFTKMIRFSDFKIGILCSLVTIISSISMVFAATTLEIIMFALLDIPKILLLGIPKSIITKCVNEDEIGKFFSFCQIGECILPIGLYYLYDYIFTTTSTTLPGAFYLASAAILAILLILYSISPYFYTPLEDCDEETKNVPHDQEDSEEVSQLPRTSYI